MGAGLGCRARETVGTTPESSLEEMPTTSPLQEEVLCSEGEFLHLLPDRVRPLLAARALLAAGRRSSIGARGYSYISEQAQDLEHFLDDHDAQRNRSFATLRELVASARGFASIGINLSA